MSPVNELLKSALELPDEERADLAHQLLLSLDPEEVTPDSQLAWEEELDARMDRLERGESTARDWRESIAAVREAFAQAKVRKS